MSHLRKIQVVDQEILWLTVLETTCSTGCLLPIDRERSCYMAVIYMDVVLKVMLSYEPRLWHPTWNIQPGQTHVHLKVQEQNGSPRIYFDFSDFPYAVQGCDHLCPFPGGISVEISVSHQKLLYLADLI
jgi:hypothetical protein